MVKSRAAQYTGGGSVAFIQLVEFAGAVQVSFNSDARIPGMSIVLALDAS